MLSLGTDWCENGDFVLKNVNGGVAGFEWNRRKLVDLFIFNSLHRETFFILNAKNTRIYFGFHF